MSSTLDHATSRPEMHLDTSASGWADSPSQSSHWLTHPAWAIGSALLWGAIELFALVRARRSSRRH